MITFTNTSGGRGIGVVVVVVDVVIAFLLNTFQPTVSVITSTMLAMSSRIQIKA
jgi:hypothetical protein